ncbi:typIV pilin [Vibrio ostreicida]|uniref:TypIV pilin n=1 Tax=Vibrio ostreicida TaxID=526588 RepID=A0ABT8BUV3_9VIBR|nr:hypothetical protein [Vibrio ostreicida]MDN3610743.1 typIV pilin [Vibrio ostreicida]NPD07260.1 typIV pilin [Vibrio ostreicida]
MINSSKGGSLIEVLIASVLLAISALSLLKLQIYIESNAKASERKMTALSIAESVLERYTMPDEFFNQSHDFLTLSPFACQASPSCQAPTTEQYQTHCQVSAVVNMGTPFYRVDVEVCWWDRHGNKQSVNLSTGVSK